MRIEVTVERLDAEVLRAKARVVLEDYAKEFGKVATTQITRRIWAWPGPTLRFKSALMGGIRQPKGGVLIDEGPRDIVDTGGLLKSLEIGKAVGDSISVTWTAPYAKNVILGKYKPYINPQGNLAQPGYGFTASALARDFVGEAQAKLPFFPFLAQRWKQLSR